MQAGVAPVRSTTQRTPAESGAEPGATPANPGTREPL
jgi:hypothetical protein